MTTLGKTTDGSGNSSSSADKTVVSQFTASGSGPITAGHARLWVTSGSASVEMVVYADSSGAPGALLATSDTLTVSNTSEAQKDFTFTGAQQYSVVNGTAYWIGFTWPDPGANSVTWSRDATASQSQQNSSHAANPFGSATSLSGPIDAYVDFTPQTSVSGSDSGTLSSTSSIFVDAQRTDSATMSEGTTGLLRASTGTDSGALSAETAALTEVLSGTDSATMSSVSTLKILGIVGKTTVGSSSTASSIDKTAVSKFTAGATGTLATGHARMWVSSGSATTKLVVYADSSGAPGAKLGESDEITVTNTSTAIKDFVFTGANQAGIVSGVDYWIGAAWLDPGSPTLSLSRDGTSSQRQEVNSYAPDPFGTPSAQTGPVDVWVETDPTGTVPKTGTDSGALSEASTLTTITQVNKTGSDSGALSESSSLFIQLQNDVSDTDSGTLTEEPSVVTEVDTFAGTDSGTLSEASELLDLVEKEASDSAALSEGSTTLGVFLEDAEVYQLLEDRFLDKPPESGEVFGLVEETAEVTVIGAPFYFGPDQYFGPNVYFGGALQGGVDPTGGTDPDRDGGFTASQTGAATPADFAVLVAITTTGEVVDELIWENWSYTDSIDWARSGTMEVTVPLLGKDHLGELTRESLKNIRNSMSTVALVLTRKGRALWAGPVNSMSWDDDKVTVQCVSIGKIMDYRIVVDPDYLLNPMDTAGNVSFELNPRDLVIRLLELGMTGERRALPILLPALTGQSGPLVEYAAEDLGTVSERIKEQVERDGGPDVLLHAELSLDQSLLTWQAIVEEHIGSTTSEATWDYPVTIKSLSGDADASQMVTTGYVLGDTSTNVGTLRGVGVHAVDRGSLPPALERADRTSVSNQSQDQINALAVSFTEVNSVPAETWAVSVHAEAEPILGEEWGLGDYVTITVTGHPWLDDGEYVRRVVGITHSPDTIELETTEVSRALFPVIEGGNDGGGVVVPDPDPIPGGGTGGGDGGTGGGTGGGDGSTVQTLGVGGVATPPGAILGAGTSGARLHITTSGTSSSPRVYDGQGRTVGGVDIDASWVKLQNYVIKDCDRDAVAARGVGITIQNCDISQVQDDGTGDINGVTFFGNQFTAIYNTIGVSDTLVKGDPGSSHTDAFQTWNNDPGEQSSDVIIRWNKVIGPAVSDPKFIHQFVMAQGRLATDGGGGGTGDSTRWLIADNDVTVFCENQVIKLNGGITEADITRNTFAGAAPHVIEISESSSGRFWSDNVITGTFGNVGTTVKTGSGPTVLTTGSTGGGSTETPVPVGQTTNFTEGFASGLGSSWSSVQTHTYEDSASSYPLGSEYRLNIVSQSAEHPHVLRTEVRDGDTAVGTHERSELSSFGKSWNSPDGAEEWFEIDVRFGDPTWSPGWSGSNDWLIFMQWHQVNDDGAPALALAVHNDNKVYFEREPDSDFEFMGPLWTVRPGVWEHLVVHIKWSSSSSVGFIQAHLNGVEILPKTFRKTMYVTDHTDPYYLKIGQYRRSSISGTTVVEHDNLRVSTLPATVAPDPDPDPPIATGDIPWAQAYPDGTAYPTINGGGSGTPTNLSSLSSAVSGGIYTYSGPTITSSVSVDFTGKSNITIRGIVMGQGGKLTPKAGTNIVLEVNAPYELSAGGEIVKWVGLYNKVRIDNSLFGPASAAGSPTTTKNRFVQFGDSTSVGAKFGTVTRTTFRNKNGPGNPVHAVGNTASSTGGVRYTLITECLFQGVKPFDENDHESALMGISTLQLTDGQQVIEFCRFEDCRSEPEVISMKMNKSTIRGNTFHNCVGSVSLRHGDDGVIQDNWIYGFEQETGTGSYNRTSAGPRMYGARHYVHHNTIQVNGNGGSRPSATSLYESPLTLDSGDVAPGTTSNGHANVVGVLVEKNLLVKCGNPIMVVDNYGTAPTGTVRSNWVVECANTPADGVGTKGSSPSKSGLAISSNAVYATTTAAGLTAGSGGHYVAPDAADRGARVVYLTAAMVGRSSTFDPWA